MILLIFEGSGTPHPSPKTWENNWSRQPNVLELAQQVACHRRIKLEWA